MSGWEIRFSNSRQQPYFYHAASSKSVWERPAELSDADVAQLTGAHYLKQAAAGGGGGGSVPAGKVRASHILAKHAGSRRPSSWKEVSPSEIRTGQL